MRYRCADTNEEAIDYEHYLRTDHWRALRIRIYDKRKAKCEFCEMVLPKNEFQVHHKTYERVGHEREKDLVLCCQLCHQKEHDRLDKAKLTKQDKIKTPRDRTNSYYSKISRDLRYLSLEQLEKVANTVDTMKAANKMTKGAYKPKFKRIPKSDI